MLPFRSREHQKPATGGVRLWASCRWRWTKQRKLKGPVRFKGTDGPIAPGLQEPQWLILSRQGACFCKTLPGRRKEVSVKTVSGALSAPLSFSFSHPLYLILKHTLRQKRQQPSSMLVNWEIDWNPFLMPFHPRWWAPLPGWYSLDTGISRTQSLRQLWATLKWLERVPVTAASAFCVLFWEG